VFERFTERARQVVVLAQDEARALKHNYIGTEHILLGLVRENEGVAARILLDFDADAEKIRNEIIRMLSGPGRRQAGAGQRPAEASGKTAVIYARKPIVQLLLPLVVVAIGFGFPLGLLVGWLIWG